MATTTTQAQGLVLALFGASAGGHLTGLAAASSLESLAGDLSTSAGMILGKDLSSNTAFRDHVTSNLKLTGDALTAANAWLDGQLNAGAARGDTLAAAVNFLSTLTDTTSPFYASAQAFQATVTAAVAWSTGAGATEFGVSALRAQQGNVDVIAGSSFTLTTATAGDQFVGTAGNDAIVGTSSTYGSADVMLDSSATDVDALTLTITSDVSATPTLANIEKVNVTFSGFTAGGNTTLAFAADNIGGNTAFNFETTGNTAVTTLNPTALATGSSITASSTFSTITATADDNAALTINGAAKTAASTVTVGLSASTGALTDVNATVTTGHLSLTASDADGAITATAAQDVTVNAAAATSAVISAGDDVTITSLAAATDVSIVAGDDVSGSGDTLDAATTLSITAGGQVDVDFDAALAATVSAKGVNLSATGGADETSTLTGDLATTLNLSGNGGAADFDILGINLVKTLNVSGEQNVKVLMDIGDIDGLASSTGLTLNNSNTGTTTLSISGTLGANANIRSVANTTAIVFTADMETADSSPYSISLANGAAVTFAAAQGATTATKTAVFTASSTTASTNAATFTMDKPNASSSTYAIGDMTTSNIKTVTINLDKDTASTTLGTISVGATNNLNLNLGVNALTSVTDITASTLTVTGSGDLTLADLSISSLDASAAEGDITYQAASGDVVQTGAGDDTISGVDDFDANLSLGAGDDAVTLTGDLSDNTVVVDMGDGSLDNLTIADSANISSSGVLLAGVEKITLAGSSTVRDTQLNGQDFVVYGTASTTHATTIEITQAANDFSDLSFDTATVTSGNDYFVISASSRTSAVTITGTGSDDRITGAAGGTAVYADVLNGDAGADTIYLNEGGDVINGGSGIDTLDLTTIDGAYTDIEGGTSDATGMLVNLGATSVATTTLLTNLDGSYMSKSLTSVAAGSVAYLFATDATTNSSVLATVSNIENVTGSDGIDYIVGSAAANVITGGTSVDYIDGGAGNDTIDGGAAADIISGGAGDDQITGAAGNDLITAGAGADTILFAGGSGNDTITLGTSGTATDGSADIVKWNFTTVASLAATDNVKTIYGFEATTGSDVIQFAQGLLATSSGTTATTTDSFQTVASGSFSDAASWTSVASNKVFFEVAGTSDVAAGSGANATAVWAAIGTDVTTSVVSTAKVLFAVDDGTDTFLWYFSSANTLAAAADITLVGVVKSVTDVATGDFAIV